VSKFVLQETQFERTGKDKIAGKMTGLSTFFGILIKVSMCSLKKTVKCFKLPLV